LFGTFFVKRLFTLVAGDFVSGNSRGTAFFLAEWSLVYPSPTVGGGTDTNEPLVTKSLFSEFFHRLMHKRNALKGILKFTLKQLKHVSV